MLSGPHQIIGGKSVPISAAQWGRDSQGCLLQAAQARRPAAAASAPPRAPEQSEAETRAKAKAFDAKMAAQAAGDRVSRRTAALQRTARMGGPEGAAAKRVLAEDAAAAGRKAEADELAALPRSIEEAGGDARAYMLADMKRRVAAAAGKGTAATSGAAASRASMERLLRASGREPVKR